MKSGFPGSIAGKEYTWQGRRPRFDSWDRKISLRRDRLPTPVFLGFPGGSVGKESACNAWDQGLIPGLGDPLEGMADHSSILAWRIPVDRAAWWATVHGVAEWDTMERLSTAHARNQLLSQWPKRISATQGPHETWHSAAYATHLVFEDMWVLIYKISVTFC